MEVLQRRGRAEIAVPDEFPVDLGSTPVNDGFLFCGQFARAHELFAEGQ